MADSLQNPFGGLIGQIQGLAQQKQSPESAALQFKLMQAIQEQTRQNLASDYLSSADFSRNPAASLRMLGSILNNPDLIRSSLDVQMKADAFELEKKRIADLQEDIRRKASPEEIAAGAVGTNQQGLAIEQLQQAKREAFAKTLETGTPEQARGAAIAAQVPGAAKAGAEPLFMTEEQKKAQGLELQTKELGLQEKQSLIDQRKQDILESQARIKKMQAEIEGGGKGKPITQTARATFIRGTKKDVESNIGIKAYKQSARYIGLINTIVDDLNKRIASGESINRIATDQGVINLWNRVQEPGSVTRIEEFRTTAEGEPIINRLSALIQKVKAGGAGITVESMNEIKRLANVVGKSLTDDANVDIEAYRQIVKDTLPDVSNETLDAIARPFSAKDYSQNVGVDNETETQPVQTFQSPAGNISDEEIRQRLEQSIPSQAQ